MVSQIAIDDDWSALRLKRIDDRLVRMCGKFTAKASWTEIVDFAWSDPGREDRILTYRVMANLPVIVSRRRTRRVVPMRWGFPHPKDWRRPQPIHARAETIDTMPAFADAFRDGQRGIVLVETFNEAPDNGEQHVVTPGRSHRHRFCLAALRDRGLPPLLACVMVTVPANSAARRPAHRPHAGRAGGRRLGNWLGENGASPDEVKACLKTVEDVRWTMRARSAPSRPGAQNRRFPTPAGCSDS